MAEETWKKLVYEKLNPECNSFEISSFGRLRNISTRNILKLDKLRSGYYSVRVRNGYKKKIHIIIHKAVAYTFLNNPCSLPEVNHINGIKTDNRVENLEWCSSSDNQYHKYKIGLFDLNSIRGEKNGQSKLTNEDVQFIKENYKPGSRELGTRALAKKYNVSHNTIRDVLNGITWNY